jgi:hypothetical protein
MDDKINRSLIGKIRKAREGKDIDVCHGLDIAAQIVAEHFDEYQAAPDVVEHVRYHIDHMIPRDAYYTADKIAEAATKAAIAAMGGYSENSLQPPKLAQSEISVVDVDGIRNVLLDHFEGNGVAAGNLMVRLRQHMRRTTEPMSVSLTDCAIILKQQLPSLDSPSLALKITKAVLEAAGVAYE